MSKKMIIIATSLVLIGTIIFVGVMTMFKWDFKKLTTDKYVTNEYEITDSFKNISVKTVTADIIFLPSFDNDTKVICRERINVKHTVEVKEDTLNISVVDNRKWYEHISINFETPKITVYIPNGEYYDLFIKDTTGDVTVPDGFTFANADISVTTGDISFESSVSGALKCNTTTGDIDLRGIRCETLTTTCTTGDTEMNDVIAISKMTVKSTTGDIEFEACDAGDILIKVTTGDIEGSLLTDKIFEAKATTGKVDVPKSRNGGFCRVSATTGSIKIDIKQ